MFNQPDTNLNAPHSKKQSDEDERRPDMDTPPPPTRHDAAAFDRGTAAADEEARSGTLPGADDPSPIQPTGDRDAYAKASGTKRTNDKSVDPHDVNTARNGSMSVSGTGKPLGDGLASGAEQGVAERGEFLKDVDQDADE
jgi:hypothetical protein